MALLGGHQKSGCYMYYIRKGVSSSQHTQTLSPRSPWLSPQKWRGNMKFLQPGFPSPTERKLKFSSEPLHGDKNFHSSFVCHFNNPKCKSCWGGGRSGTHPGSKYPSFHHPVNETLIVLHPQKPSKSKLPLGKRSRKRPKIFRRG